FATQLRVGDVPPMEHRFSTTDAVAMGVAEALEAVVQRMPDVRGVYVVWRNTVAGTTPGPIPQRVEPAEGAPDGSAVATAYRMDSALRRAGIPAVVEVLEADAPWPEYHRQAVRAAIRVAGATGAGYDTYSGYEPSYRDDRRETAGDAMSSVPETASHEYPSWPSVPEHGSESAATEDRKSTRLNSSHVKISYAVFCLARRSPPFPYTTLFRSRAAIRVAGATGAGYDTYSGYEPSYRDDRRETAGDAMSSVPETASHEYPSWPSVPEHGSESAAT